MGTTVDHLNVDYRVTLLRDVRDPAGNSVKAGEVGVIRHLSFDDLRMEVHLGLDLADRKVELVLPVKVSDGPRLGHYKEYFELGDYVPVPGTERVFHDPASRTMIVPTTPPAVTSDSDPDWWKHARELADNDRMKEAEEAVLRAVDHIGCAASIAELYADRMRYFQRMGDEPKAVEAFKKAVDWMGNYASSATSGGEGVALSYERDRFHEDLAKEFGYDPLAS